MRREAGGATVWPHRCAFPQLKNVGKSHIRHALCVSSVGRWEDQVVDCKQTLSKTRRWYHSLLLNYCSLLML